MKMIIKGKKYDTNTAKEIGVDSDGCSGDFGYYEETLYKKRNGEYFLYGEGGPSSKYSKAVGMNCWEGGCDITPLSVDEAKEWGEHHMSVEDYEKEFGTVEE